MGQHSWAGQAVRAWGSGRQRGRSGLALGHTAQRGWHAGHKAIRGWGAWHKWGLGLGTGTGGRLGKVWHAACQSPDPAKARPVRVHVPAAGVRLHKPAIHVPVPNQRNGEGINGINEIN